MPTASPNEHTFGPAVAIATNLSDKYKPIEVDLVRLGNNLKADFPELAQEDWDRTVTLLSDEFDENVGGYSFDLRLLRSSRATRLLFGANNKIRQFLLGYPKTPSIKWVDQRSGGKDGITIVNVSSSIKGNSGHKLYPVGKKVDRSTILAHELKHTVDHLLEGPESQQELVQLDKLSKRIIYHLGAFAIGAVGVAGSSLELIYSINNWSEKAVMGGGISLLGSLAILSSPIYLVIKHKTLSRSKFGLEWKEPIYGTSEEVAEAYSIATENKWNGIIGHGVVETSVVDPDDWFALINTSWHS